MASTLKHGSTAGAVLAAAESRLEGRTTRTAPDSEHAPVAFDIVTAGGEKTVSQSTVTGGLAPGARASLADLLPGILGLVWRGELACQQAVTAGAAATQPLALARPPAWKSTCE
jgi:hypothetical protein